MDVLAGSPRIDTVRALVPRRGRDAGRLVVWVKVLEAGVTARGLAREWPGTVETGRVAVRLGGATRVAEEQLDLNRGRLAVGYYFRFARRAAGRMTGIGDRVSVVVQAAQTVDLGLGRVGDDRGRAKTTRLVTVDRPAIAIEPRDGVYQNAVDDTLWVARGGVRQYFFLSSTPVCHVGPSASVSVPIDPETGLFSFTAKTDSSIISTVQGAFRDNTSAVVKASVSVRECNYRVVPSTFSLSTDL